MKLSLITSHDSGLGNHKPSNNLLQNAKHRRWLTSRNVFRVLCNKRCLCKN